MSSGKILEAYFLTGIIVTLLCFACGIFNSKPTDVGQHTTHKSYNQLQRLTDDDSLITTVEKPRVHPHFTHAHQSKITDIVIKPTNKISSKWRENELHRFRKKKKDFSNKFLRKIRHSKNWLSRIVKEKGNSKKVIHRKSRDDGTYGNGDDDENIQSKDEDEDEDEDVQLIIIPRKPRKHLRPKVQDEEDTNEGFQESEDTENDSENDNGVSENSVDESENFGQHYKNSEDDSENINRNSKNSENYSGKLGNYSENVEDDSSDSENFKNSRKVSKKPHFNFKNFRHLMRNHHRGNYKNFHPKSKNTNDDATLTLERVAPEENDDDDSKNSHQSDAGDYDLHLKVKDKSGTTVKLSGDLPGNIGNLMAVGEDGGKVQIKNTGENSREKSSEDLKTVELQDGGNEATTDKMAQNLIKMKSGKLKHSPYPSTILLDKSPKFASEENPLKGEGSDESSPQALPANTLTSLTRDEANPKAAQPTNQQPSNNIFAPMEFENGDDELMATSRLLDIAQKTDDASSLKEIKDPSNTVKEPRQPTKSLKKLTKGIAERQTSKAFLKSTPTTPEDYKKQSEDIDKESDDNWYKMQSLEDRVVNEGSSAKTGKDVGSYNGSSPPIVLPDQAIHGTQRRHFEIHDLTDISGGKWKAVHIPDEDISSMLQIASAKKGGNMSLDIQHEDPVELPVEVHGRVQAFEHNLMNNKTKNSTASVGKLIVATEDEHRGKEVGALHTAQPSVIKLRGYMKEVGPKNREIIHRKTSVKPSLVVAKIPEDDDDDSDDLPLRKLPTPIVAPLRKTRPKIKPGSMRSNILAGIIHPANKPRVLLPSNIASNNPKKLSVSQNISANENTVTNSPGTKNDPMVLEKIKSLLLKSSPNPKQSPVNLNTATKQETEIKSQAITLQNTNPDTQNNLPASKPNYIPPASQQSKAFPTTKANKEGLFLPPKFARPSDAFSNHASVLNRISEPKREALLLGIIKALLGRDRVKTSSAGPMMNGAVAGLPHYNRQAILQGLQNLQMRKTVATAQNDAAAPGDLGTGNPAMPRKNLDEIYQKEREEDVKQELARANEEALEAKKMHQEESEMLTNYDLFSNPESRTNWGNIAGRDPQHSQTPDGQVLSMLGSPQLDMLADNPSTT